MADISVDFSSLRVSALRKAIRISDSIDGITLGPESINKNTNESWEENIENEKNSCNINGAKNSTESAYAKTNNSSTRSGITFSIKKILLENEKQRQEDVRKAMDKRKKDMERSEIAMQREMETMKKILAAKREQEKAAERARLDEEKRIAQQDEIKHRHEAQLNAQRIQERKETFLLNLEKEAEEQRLKERQDLIEKIDPLRLSFREKCREVAVLSKMSNDNNSVAQMLIPYSAKLKELSQQMEMISEVARSGELTANDVAVAENIVKQSEEVLEFCKSEMYKIDALHEQEIARREYEVQQAEIVAARDQQTLRQNAEQNFFHAPQDEQSIQPQPEGLALPETPPNEIASNAVETTDSSSVETVVENKDNNQGMECLQLFARTQKFLEDYVGSYRDFLHSAVTKKFQIECKKAVRNPLNTISNVNGSHLMETYEKLNMLLQGRAVPNINQYPQGPAFCKNLIAKCIVNQGETLVSRKPETAPLIAAIAVSLWTEYPDLGDLMLAHFRTICPYITPIFLPRYQGQSNEEYYKSHGYKYVDGVVEKQDKFLKRMSGIMRLYVSIIVAKQRRGNDKPHPHGLQHAWRWLAAMLNFELRVDLPDVCATMILDMLEVAGNSLWRTYPRQLPKLLVTIINQYYPQVQSNGGPVSPPMESLKLFLENCLQKQMIPVPVGQLPPNFW